MRRLASLIVVATLATAPACTFAVKHPAATAGIVAGTIALGTCELASPDHAKCFITSGAVGVGLALIAAGALWLGSEDEPAPAADAPPPKVDWEQVPDTTPAQPTTAPPPAPTTPTTPTTPAPAPPTPAPPTPAPPTPATPAPAPPTPAPPTPAPPTSTPPAPALPTPAPPTPAPTTP